MMLFSLFPAISSGVEEKPALSTEAVYTADDILGRTVTLTQKPESIVIAGKATMIVADALSLFPSYQKRVIGLGVTDQGLGDFYQNFNDKASPARFPHSVQPEEIAGLQPDLVLIKSKNFPTLGDQLEKLGIPVFPMELESIESYYKEIRALGSLLGESERAEEITQWYQSKTDAVSAKISDHNKDSGEKVLMLYATVSDGITSFQIPPASWIQTDMVEMSGGNPVWTEEAVGGYWQKVSFEQIAAWDPDRIYIISYKVPALLFIDEVKNSPLWKELTSYKTGRITAFPADFHNWAQPDTRWILAVQWLARDLYPGLFQDASSEDEIEEFYRELYGFTDDSVIEDLKARYKGSLTSWKKE